MKNLKIDPEIAYTPSHFYKEKEFWLNKLSGELVKSKFIYDNKKKKADQSPLEELKFSLNKEPCSRLMKLANESDLRLLMILAAGLTLLIYRYTSSADIIWGTTISKQKFDGYFINTILALRNKVDGNITFKELLLQVKDKLQEAIENQNYPLETLVNDLNLNDPGGDFPLFEIGILLENIQDKNYFNNIKLNVLFTFFRTGDNIEGRVEYNSALYHHTTIQRIVNHYINILTNAVSSLNNKLSEIDMLSEEERQQILVDFNGNQAEIPGKTVVEFIEKQAEVIPGHCAIGFEGNQTTYRELNENANQLARVLRKYGIKENQPVCLLLHRSPLMMECILAIWKAGGAYTPIDPQDPAKRVIGILKNSRAGLLLTHSQHLHGEIEENHDGDIIRLDQQVKENIENPDTAVEMNCMAYVIYTSGSTGKPKGVMIEHIGMMNHMQAKIKDFHMSGDSIVAQNASHTFDISVWQFFCSLMVGGQTVIYSRELILETQRFISEIIEDNITILEVVPSYLSILLDCLDYSSQGFNTLKYLIVTGEELKPALVKRWFARCPGTQMANAYGPTEASDDITHYIFDQPTDSARIPIGKPLQNFNIYVTDQNMGLCPIGVEGEICVSGIGVGPGYLNDEKKTNQVFMIDPFKDGKKIRLFKTGDLGRWLPDGNIEFFGRKDFQVKIRGFRIELGEIESILSDHDDIKEAVVIDRDDQKGNKELCAYIVAHRKAQGAWRMELKEFLSKTLPDYMIPSYFVELDQFPLTQNGKINRKALPEPASENESKIIYLTARELDTIAVRPARGPMVKELIEETIHEEYQLSGEERKKILYTFNLSDRVFSLDKSLPELFEEQVEKSPDSISVVYKSHAFTYRQLNRKTNQLAWTLRQKGVKKDTIVGFMLDNSIEMIMVILGILKAGGAYMPMDSWLPPARRNYMVRHTKTMFLITRHQYMETFPGGGEIIDMEQVDLFQGNDNNLGINTGRDDLFYVTFTSGTTGKPKGSALQHGGFFNHMMWFINELNLDVKDRVLLLTSVAFDLTQKSIFAPIITGGGLCFPSLNYLDTRIILEDIADYQISWINCTPSIFYKILEFCEDDELVYLSSLKYALFGGEPLLLDPLKRWIQSDAFKTEIVNSYGVTECAGISAFYRIKNPDSFYYKKIPIGKPVSNCQLYILDKHFSPTPIGISGELYISGKGVGVGYLNDPAASDEKFIHISFEDGSHRFAYRTGDYARWLPDGQIEFLGRIDNQVNIEGIRIELEDIERCLLSHDDIKEAAVIDKENINGDIILVGFFVSGRSFSILELREYLSKELPLFMIPSYFVRLEKMPLTPNRKLDRSLIKAIDIEMGMDSQHVGPRNEIEKKLVEICEYVLGIEKDSMGIDGNFFEMGGHSLKMTLLVAKVHKDMDIKLLLKDVFQYPTVRELAALIQKTNKDKFITLKPVEKKEYYPMASAQERLYVLQQLDNKSTAYNIPLIYELEGNIPGFNLEDIFRHLIKRHESLRTSYELVEDEVVQKIYDEVEFKIEYYDMKEVEVKVEEVEQKTEDRRQKTEKKRQTVKDKPVTHLSSVIRHLSSEFIRPFDLSRAPLLRVRLIKLLHTPTALRGHPSQEGKEDKYLLMVDMHHIITDAISMQILVQDFIALCKKEELPMLRLQYKDYSQWQQDERGKEELKKQEEYWLKKFAGNIPVLKLQTDHARPLIQSFAGSSVDFDFGHDETTQLNELAAANGATLFMVFMALFNVFLSRLSGQTDIVVGTALEGREHENLRHIIGMFVNTLPLRSSPQKEKTFNGFLQEVKTCTLEAFENQGYQFEELVEKLVPHRDTSRNPIFDVRLLFEKNDTPRIEIPGLTLKFFNNQRQVSKFDLTLWIFDVGTTINFTIEYCTALFKKETIDWFSRYFKEIMFDVIKNPNQKLSEIGKMADRERKEKLSQFTDDLENE